MSTESVHSLLIKNPDLLQPLMSDVITCKNECNHPLKGVNMFTLWLLWFFRVVGWWRKYKTRKGNTVDLTCVGYQPPWLILVKTRESNHVTQ